MDRDIAQPAFPWERRLGARVLASGGSEFRVWAPQADRIELRCYADGCDVEMAPVGHGVHEVHATVAAGEDYAFVLDGTALPDPCSRWQPEGLRGPSRLFDPPPPAPPRPCPGLGDLVIYELHVGTFTPEGTFDAAIAELRQLAGLGITAIELMPVAEFPGERGWGYDGVYISAAQHSYGGPQGLARLVNAAHEAGLAVILDVVYNHVGASGVEALAAFGPYFTAKYGTPWGKAINYDDADSDPVREWVCQSAAGWIRDFGIDGLRLDAIHAIFDSSADHIVAAVARRVHQIRKDALVIAESGLNDPRVVRPPERGGYACDAAWSDDFHHSLRALLTGERDGYYEDFGRVADLAKAFHRPQVLDGRYSEFRRHRFGAPADDVPPDRFVVFSQNHDQVGNRALGDRMPPAARPLAAFCTLLAPFVPLLFMGEEYGEPAPFQFFSDHIDPEIAQATREGRRQEFAAFAEFAHVEIPDPQDRETFERSKLTRVTDASLAHLYRRLLAVRGAIPPGSADEIAFDEQQRWLLVRRGRYELACNFASEPRRVECQGTQLELSTHAAAGQPAGGQLELPPLSGALLR
jgi:maltooligosyltrehalose trehalohydrolase